MDHDGKFTAEDLAIVAENVMRAKELTDLLADADDKDAIITRNHIDALRVSQALKPYAQHSQYIEERMRELSAYNPRYGPGCRK